MKKGFKYPRGRYCDCGTLGCHKIQGGNMICDRCFHIEKSANHHTAATDNGGIHYRRYSELDFRGQLIGQHYF